MAYSDTVRSLCSVAELLVAGPQYARSGSDVLQCVNDGFASTSGWLVRVSATTIALGRRVAPLVGTYAGIGAMVGITPQRLEHVQGGPAPANPSDVVVLDAYEADAALSALTRGDLALRSLSGEASPAGLTARGLRVTRSQDDLIYGVTPGDDTIHRPFAFVERATSSHPRMTLLVDASVKVTDIADFFRDGPSNLEA